MNDLLENLYTKKDASEFIRNLDELSNLSFKDRIDLNEQIRLIFGDRQKEKIIAFCKTHNIDLTNSTELQKFIALVKDALQKLPLLTIEVALELTTESINHISSWFLSCMKRKVLLDLVVRKEIIGAAIIVSNGIYRDYSLKKKLEETYKDTHLFTG